MLSNSMRPEETVHCTDVTPWKSSPRLRVPVPSGIVTLAPLLAVRVPLPKLSATSTESRSNV
jgi:hypothetical protein